MIHDSMVRLQREHPPNPRLLIVEITEKDIQEQQRWPIDDAVVAQLIQKLQTYHPKVIGLDIYRDIPQGTGFQQLQQQFRADNVIGITKIGDSEDIGVRPPIALPPERVGFNDFPLDPDGIVRRNLLIANTDTQILYSFSLRLALNYLAGQNIFPEASKINPDYLQLKNTVFFPLDENSGAYQNIDASGYQILLKYRIASSIAQKVSLTQVLKGEIDPALVRGKVVLIGATARSARDFFLTPYGATNKEKALTSGVEIHAQSVNQILNAVLDGRRLFWFWQEWAEVLWITGWALVGGILGWYLRHPILLSGASTLAIGVLGGSSLSLFLCQSCWIPIAAPTMALVATGGIVVAYQAYKAQRQQQIVMTLLGQNTSPEIATALWKSRDRLIKSGKLPGQRLIATMLFTDVKNFSTISEQMPPEFLLDWLNEYLEAITHEVKLHQGIINKFTGDGLLAVFGVPVTRHTVEEIAEDARNAVSCALAMGDRLSELNQVWQERGLPSIEMRVGIFTGTVVVGSLGGKDRLEYGVIGDSVNIASRLESYAKERQSEICRILIAHDTLVYIQSEFAVESWGPVALKGKHQVVEVYRVLGHQTKFVAPVIQETQIT
ncbi:MAG: adenylate/guanylate cyclase domain-containing protein [Scytolyngbya sp. HA4215-MV1]|nr:adenylate/guanylate cyclase domain-containing protein [Scytolyngbya sp. HA4215-MV1]